jgi:hypothetical protein
MTKARNLATLTGSATVLATDSYVAAAVATVYLTPLIIADVMDSL